MKYMPPIIRRLKIRSPLFCSGHLDICGSTCPECGFEIDEFGNTSEYQEYCSLPCCGCPEHRLCMANGYDGIKKHAVDDLVNAPVFGSAPREIDIT